MFISAEIKNSAKRDPTNFYCKNSKLQNLLFLFLFDSDNYPMCTFWNVQINFV